MKSPPLVHAIVIALNEQDFISACLEPLYPHCAGISVITQYDRNWYGNKVVPDETVKRVLDFPDPEGKLSLHIRRHIDEGVARNFEMRSTNRIKDLVAHVIPHAVNREQLAAYYRSPDYFLIVDADEIFDIETFPRILEYLSRVRPRIMHLSGYEYARRWNDRVPPKVWMNRRIGFLRAGVYFRSRRVQSYLHIRMTGLAKRTSLAAWCDRHILGNIDCPPEIGVFHHGAMIKPPDQLEQRAKNHSEKLDYGCADNWQNVRDQATIYVPTSNLPSNIVRSPWPDGFIDHD